MLQIGSKTKHDTVLIPEIRDDTNSTLRRAKNVLIMEATIMWNVDATNPLMTSALCRTGSNYSCKGVHLIRKCSSSKSSSLNHPNTPIPYLTSWVMSWIRTYPTVTALKTLILMMTLHPLSVPDLPHKTRFQSNHRIRKT